MKKDRSALELALDNGGILTMAQAADMGFSRGEVRWRVDTGEWTQVRRGVFRLVESRAHFDVLREAVSVLPGAVVSHESAAELHNMPRVRRGVLSVSVHTRTTHRYGDVVIRRNHDLQESHVTEVAGMPVTTIPRTVADLASVLSESHLSDVVEDLLAETRLDLDAFAGVVDVVARRGRPGATTLKRIRDEYVDGPPRPGSTLERRGRRLLASAGLAAPKSEFPVPWSRSRRFDDAYPEMRIAIEWDSRRWHLRTDAFESDRRRDNEALLHGWQVFRFTWRDVTERPDYVLACVRDALAGAALHS